MSRELKITGHIVERDGFRLDAKKIAEAHAELHKRYGAVAATKMCQAVTAYLSIAIAVCDAKAGDSTPRGVRGQAATNYLKALAEGADQLFAQIIAKGN